jgi:hypothetical protein
MSRGEAIRSRRDTHCASIGVRAVVALIAASRRGLDMVLHTFICPGHEQHMYEQRIAGSHASSCGTSTARAAATECPDLVRTKAVSRGDGAEGALGLGRFWQSKVPWDWEGSGSRRCLGAGKVLAVEGALGLGRFWQSGCAGDERQTCSQMREDQGSHWSCQNAGVAREKSSCVTGTDCRTIIRGLSLLEAAGVSA